MSATASSATVVGEGRTWRLLGHATECRTGDIEAGAALVRRSVEVLEAAEPGLDLAMSYVSIASFSTVVEDLEPAAGWMRRAMAIPAVAEDPLLQTRVLGIEGYLEYLIAIDGRPEKLERSLRIAIEAGLEDQAGLAYMSICGCAARVRDYGALDRYVEEAIAYCTARDLDLHTNYLLLYRAQGEFDRCRWDAAAESVGRVLRDTPRRARGTDDGPCSARARARPAR